MVELPVSFHGTAFGADDDDDGDDGDGMGESEHGQRIVEETRRKQASKQARSTSVNR
jgi:hypothetical protein